MLGYSLGSAVAQELALAAPERVASLVLYCTWARTDACNGRSSRRWPIRGGSVTSTPR